MENIACNYDNMTISSDVQKLIENILTTQITDKVNDELKHALKGKPWWTKIHDKFQLYLDKVFPGTFVVAMPTNDSLFSLIKMDSIFIPSIDKKNLIMKHNMQRSGCHDNCDELFKKDKTKSCNIYTGYGLSDDGLWRNHSWLVDKNNNIIETTCERLIYFGYKMTNN